jgi:LacI family transcriptional regulator
VLVRECGFTEAQGYEAMKAWIKEKSVPPAVFAANDPAAIGAMASLNEAGLRVPDDVAIVGAGSIHYGDMLKVPLTTVSWSTSEMGQEAARLLLELIESKKKPRNSQQIVVKPQLVVRQSCGATKVSAV